MQGGTGSAPPVGTGTATKRSQPDIFIESVTGTAGAAAHQLLQAIPMVNEAPDASATDPPDCAGVVASTLPLPSVISAASPLPSMQGSCPLARATVTTVPREPAAPPHGSAVRVTSPGAQTPGEADTDALGEGEVPPPTPL